MNSINILIISPFDCEQSPTSLWKTWERYLSETHFAQWCNWEQEVVFFFFSVKNWHSHLFPRYLKYYILYIFLDVSSNRAYVGVLMKYQSEEKEEEGHKEERERSCCQTHNFASTQSQLIKDLSSSTWLWINLSSLLWKKLAGLFPSFLFQSVSLYFFIIDSLFFFPSVCTNSLLIHSIWTDFSRIILSPPVSADSFMWVSLQVSVTLDKLQVMVWQPTFVSAEM